MRGICRGEYGGARRDALLGQAVMHVGRSQQAKAGVMVLGVVPGEEDMAVGPGILDRAHPLREPKPTSRAQPFPGNVASSGF